MKEIIGGRDNESILAWYLFNKQKTIQVSIKPSSTERGGSVVTHETRIREVPGSNPVADQPG